MQIVLRTFSTVIVLCLLLISISAMAEQGKLHISSKPELIDTGIVTVESGNAIAIGFQTSKDFEYFEFEMPWSCVGCKGTIYFMEDLISDTEDTPSLHDALEINSDTVASKFKFKKSWLGIYTAGVYYILIEIEDGGLIIPAGSGVPFTENKIKLHSEWVLPSEYGPVWLYEKNVVMAAQWHFEVRGY